MRGHDWRASCLLSRLSRVERIVLRQETRRGRLVRPSPPESYGRRLDADGPPGLLSLPQHLVEHAREAQTAFQQRIVEDGFDFAIIGAAEFVRCRD